jgi:hypothetical protein
MPDVVSICSGDLCSWCEPIVSIEGDSNAYQKSLYGFLYRFTIFSATTLMLAARHDDNSDNTPPLPPAATVADAAAAVRCPVTIQSPQRHARRTW